jgi:hypothetical protein
LAVAHVSDVRARISELEGLAVSLEALVDTSEATCASGAGSDCTILEDLSRMPRSRSCR